MGTCPTHTEQGDTNSCYLLQLQNTSPQLQKAILFIPHSYVFNSDYSLTIKINLTENLSHSMLKKKMSK